MSSNVTDEIALKVVADHVNSIMNKYKNKHWRTRKTHVSLNGCCSIINHRKWPGGIVPDIPDWMIDIGDMSNLGLRISVDMLDNTTILYTYWVWGPGKVVDYVILSLSDPECFDVLENNIAIVTQIINPSIIDKSLFCVGLGKYARMERDAQLQRLYN